MRTIKLGRPSPSFVVAMVALIAALAGTAIALPGKNSVTSNDIKKNSVKSKTVKDKSLTGKDVKDGSLNGADVADEGLTGADVDESSLGPVPSLSSLRAFSGDGDENSVTSLIRTDQVELLGVCDENGDFAVPTSSAVLEYNGSQTLTSTALVLVNRAATPAFSDTSDDDDYKLDTGEGVAFNYQDNGDGGSVIFPDGHFMMAPDDLNVLFDSSYVNSPNADDDPTGFPKACHFQGAVYVG